MKIILIDEKPDGREELEEAVIGALPGARISPVAGNEAGLAGESPSMLIETDMDMHELAGWLRAGGMKLRPEKESEKKKRVSIRTFGIFDVFIDGIPMDFYYSKSKELMAFLVDRRGKACSAHEIARNLWQEDEKAGTHLSYVSRLKKDMLAAFAEKGCADIFIKSGRELALDPQKVDCDYYDWLRGSFKPDREGLKSYMQQYSWAEVTAAWISAAGQSSEA